MQTAKKFSTHKLVMLAMLSAVLLVMSYTPLGYFFFGSCQPKA